MFGPQPRSYAQRIPKKVRRAALRAALSLRNQEGNVTHVKSIDLPEIKTRQIVEQLHKLKLDDVLIVTRERDLRLELAARNLPHVRVLAVPGLNVFDILARQNLLLVGDAPEAIVERLQ